MDYKFKNRRLDAQMFCSQEVIDLSSVRHTFDTRHERYGTLVGKVNENLVQTLSVWLYGERYPAKEIDVTFESPTTWWEHLKQTHAPKWFLMKYPVKYKTTTKSVVPDGFRVLYPNFKPAGNMHYVVIRESDSF